jgi:hypothetical protein
LLSQIIVVRQLLHVANLLQKNAVNI